MMKKVALKNVAYVIMVDTEKKYFSENGCNTFWFDMYTEIDVAIWVRLGIVLHYEILGTIDGFLRT